MWLIIEKVTQNQSGWATVKENDFFLLQCAEQKLSLWNVGSGSGTGSASSASVANLWGLSSSGTHTTSSSAGSTNTTPTPTASPRGDGERSEGGYVAIRAESGCATPL